MKNKKTTGRAAGPASSVDLAEVERLLKFMTDHGLEEFEYARRDLHIRLKKTAATQGVVLPRVTAAPGIVVASPHAAAAAPAGSERAAPAESGARSEDLHVVKSPIVGTFYDAPSPGAPPFVKVGDEVAAGQVLCIIEAMKLMNEIESEVAGEVVRIYGEGGQPVEYGQPLFAIHPTRKK